VSSLVIAFWPIPQQQGLVFWTFAKTHQLLYDPMTEGWNGRQTPEERVHILLLSAGALQRRLLSGFLSDTPLPDLVEAYAQIVAQAFKGPLEEVGFADLTDRLHAEGLYEQINEPSFGPWTTRGRIFGLPHDVHPCCSPIARTLLRRRGLMSPRLPPGMTLCSGCDHWCAMWTATVM
jgi:arabinosaccharide transport system substrate-binding protein